MAYSPLAIANAFLARAKAEGIPITNMKLQKLLYFAQGHSHALRKQKLIDENSEAWDYGPVFPSVWREFRGFGAREISRFAVGDDAAYWFAPEDDKPEPIAPPNEPEVNKFLDAVWNAYKKKTAIQLSEMSHVDNGPWSVTRNENPRARDASIPDALVAQYFTAASQKRAQ
jgi:uncharacterized phage-associated protein